MAPKALPSPEVLRQLLRYEPETGKLFWKERGTEWFADARYKAEVNAVWWNRKWSGAEALTADNGAGYRTGRVLGLKVKAHRVAFAIYHGKWPNGEVDHINGDTSDNRINNLRDATKSENMRNRALHSNNTSSIKGVSWRKDVKKWSAQIYVDRKQIHLGYFDDMEEAARVRAAAAAKYHGEFARPA